jgi:3-phenylpropionate/trans-cinnamate dioxygenase ferredoxin reductase component
MEHVLIVGAGLAGVQAAEALRSGGYTGQVTLLGDEPHGPYHRPPLSKAWLAGEADSAQLVMRAPDLLAKKSIGLRTGVKVVAIDRPARQLLLADGERLSYTGLVLATGASPRRLPLPGADAPGVYLLRGRDDADALQRGLGRCQASGLPLAVVGGGFIGLEVAATARKKGVAVIVLEAAPRLLARVLTPQLSDWFATLHRDHGVDLRLGAQIAGLDTDPAGQVSAVRLGDGTALPCGAVLLGVGVAANDALAHAAGLAVDRGIVVDACGRTADALIVAAGDCTARRLDDGSLLRLESVHNATEQGKCAAAALLGQPRPFAGTPWFWSDQYDRKLQMAGLSAGADHSVLRGTLQAVPFSLWHYRAGHLVAVDAVNAAKDHLLSRKLMDAGVSPTPEQAADTGFDLASLLAPK